MLCAHPFIIDRDSQFASVRWKHVFRLWIVWKNFTGSCSNYDGSVEVKGIGWVKEKSCIRSGINQKTVLGFSWLQCVCVLKYKYPSWCFCSTQTLAIKYFLQNFPSQRSTNFPKNSVSRKSYLAHWEQTQGFIILIWAYKKFPSLLIHERSSSNSYKHNLRSFILQLNFSQRAKQLLFYQGLLGNFALLESIKFARASLWQNSLYIRLTTAGQVRKQNKRF